LKKEKAKTASITGASYSQPPQTLQPMEITIGSTTYITNGFFKDFGKTVSEKLYGIMEKEVESPVTMRYNGIIPKDCLAVGSLGRASL